MKPGTRINTHGLISTMISKRGFIYESPLLPHISFMDDLLKELDNGSKKELNFADYIKVLTVRKVSTIRSVDRLVQASKRVLRDKFTLLHEQALLSMLHGKYNEAYRALTIIDIQSIAEYVPPKFDPNIGYGSLFGTQGARAKRQERGSLCMPSDSETLDDLRSYIKAFVRMYES